MPSPASDSACELPKGDVYARLGRHGAVLRRLFPTPALALLMAIGVLDLLSTALLHRAGLIVEMNPLMRVFILRSEWLFALVKGITLGGAWGAMAWYARIDRRFVHRASLFGSAAYLGLWLVWFLKGA